LEITSAPSPLCILLEFCVLGSLETLLHNSEAEISQQFQLEILLGAARGIFHLHTNNIIHRDLAARNILLSSLDVNGVKIADFGLSRTLNLLQEIGETNSFIGPIKWMSPEAMKRVYSTKSDCWSFGVVIYEVVSRELPFNTVENMEVIDLVLKEGHHVTAPTDCRESLAQLMDACCRYLPEERPSFLSICQFLEKEVQRS